WQLVSESDVSPSRWFPVFRRTYRLPDGRLIDDFFLAKLGDIAMVIPQLPDGRYGLVAQYRPGAHEITLEFPAGRIESSQTPVEAACRELEEETGLVAKDVKSLGTFFPSPTKDTARVYGFVAPGCQPGGHIKFDDTESITSVFLSAAEINAR